MWSIKRSDQRKNNANSDNAMKESELEDSSSTACTSLTSSSRSRTPSDNDNELEKERTKAVVIMNEASKDLSLSVTFGNVEIREYMIIVGDNPSVTSGPPIGIGWSYMEERNASVPLEAFEQYRDGMRRAFHEMKIPARIRLEMLREWDVSPNEIRRVQKECTLIRKQRFQTLQQDHRRLSLSCIGNCR